MPSSSNLFDLAAKISVDASQSDRALDQNQKKVIALESQYKKLDATTKTTSKTLTNDLGGALSSVAPQIGSLAAGGVVGLAIAGIALLASTAVAGANEVWALATKAGEAGGKIYDMGQKINFSSETLTGLAAAARTSGGNLDSIAASLGIFDKNLAGVTEGNKAAQVAFKELGVTAKDNETALRQTFQGLENLKGGAHQVALAMAVFGRSGKDVLGIIRETNGDLDAAIQQYHKLGLVISTEDTIAADQFGDTLQRLEDQAGAVARQLGQNTLPIFTKFFEDVSRDLEADQDKWYGWSNVIATATTIALGHVEGLERGIKAAFARMQQGNILGPLSALLDTPRFVYEETASLKSRAAITGDANNFAAGMSGLAARVAARAGGGGGGTGGGGGGASVKNDPGVKLLEQLEKQFKSLIPYTELERVQDQLLEKQYLNTSDAIKKRIQITAEEIDQRKKTLALTRERIATGIEEREEFQKFAELVQQSQTRRRSVFDITGLPYFDLGGGSVAGNDGSTRSRRAADGRTRPRVATVDKEIAMERAQIIHDQMAQLAGDLTNTLDRAVYDGFSKGAVRGFATLGEGLLDIVNRIFLARLEKGLTDILTNLGTSGGGGGGFWSKLLGLGIGAISGGFGGGGAAGGAGTAIAGAFAGKFADGGFIPPGQWGWTGENGPEPVFGGRSGATVVPAGGGGHVTFNIYTNDARSFASRETQAQIARKYSRALQKRALNS